MSGIVILFELYAIYIATFACFHNGGITKANIHIFVVVKTFSEVIKILLFCLLCANNISVGTISALVARHALHFGNYFAGDDNRIISKCAS